MLLVLALLQAPVLSPGVHNQTLPRAGEPAVRYAISIPEGYSPSKPVPLVLALHFFAPNPAGAGRRVLDVLVRPALKDLGAIIIAPDSQAAAWGCA